MRFRQLEISDDIRTDPPLADAVADLAGNRVARREAGEDVDFMSFLWEDLAGSGQGTKVCLTGTIHPAARKAARQSSSACVPPRPNDLIHAL